jgi:hypothetical protein
MGTCLQTATEITRYACSFMLLLQTENNESLQTKTTTNYSNTANGCPKTLQTGSYKIANTSIKAIAFKDTSSSKHCFFIQSLSNHYTSL